MASLATTADPDVEKNTPLVRQKDLTTEYTLTERMLYTVMTGWTNSYYRGTTCPHGLGYIQTLRWCQRRSTQR